MGATAARAFLRATLARARSGIKPAVFNARTADMVRRGRRGVAIARRRRAGLVVVSCMGKQYDIGHGDRASRVYRPGCDWWIWMWCAKDGVVVARRRRRAMRCDACVVVVVVVVVVVESSPSRRRVAVECDAKMRAFDRARDFFGLVFFSQPRAASLCVVGGACVRGARDVASVFGAIDAD